MVHARRAVVDQARYQRGAAELAAARQVADRLPPDEAGVMAMRISPRAMLCGSAWLAGGAVADTGFDELAELCAQVGETSRWPSGCPAAHGKDVAQRNPGGARAGQRLHRAAGIDRRPDWVIGKPIRGGRQYEAGEMLKHCGSAAE